MCRGSSCRKSAKNGNEPSGSRDRKSTRLNSSHVAHLVCRLLLEKKKLEDEKHRHDDARRTVQSLPRLNPSRHTRPYLLPRAQRPRGTRHGCYHSDATSSTVWIS